MIHQAHLWPEGQRLVAIDRGRWQGDEAEGATVWVVRARLGMEGLTGKILEAFRMQGRRDTVLYILFK